MVFTNQSRMRVNDALQGKASFTELSPVEWHQFVHNYNHDAGLEPLYFIANSPHCDMGTALLIYWHLNPEFYYRLAEYERSNVEDYRLIKLLEENFYNCFYRTSIFAFDPLDGYLSVEGYTLGIPPIMIHKTQGTLFPKLDVEPAFLRLPNNLELQMIQEKIDVSIAMLNAFDPAIKLSGTKVILQQMICCLEYWKDHKFGVIDLESLSYLWLDRLCCDYGWKWTVWEWGNGNRPGVSSPSFGLTCGADMIIRHIVNGFQSPNIIFDLFELLDGVEYARDLSITRYNGIGLYFSTEHLKFLEDWDESSFLNLL